MNNEQVRRELQASTEMHIGELIPPPDPDAERKALWIAIAKAKAGNSPDSIDAAWQTADRVLMEFDKQFPNSSSKQNGAF